MPEPGRQLDNPFRGEVSVGPEALRIFARRFLPH